MRNLQQRYLGWKSYSRMLVHSQHTCKPKGLMSPKKNSREIRELLNKELTKYKIQCVKYVLYS